MYETFEHTADLGLRIRADDLNGLFAEAGHALFSIMVGDLDDVRAVDEMSFTVNGNDPEEMLHDWLTELLFTFHVQRRLFVKFDVNIQPTGLTAIAYGEKIDPRRHDIEFEIKAVTWHELKVEKTPDGWLAEVIVDI